MDVVHGGHHAHRVEAALGSGAAATSSLVASWQRSSRLHRLDPADYKPPRRLGSREFDQARQRMEPLLRAAQSSLDRLYLAVGGVGCCVLLADTDGVPVDRRGAVADDDTFRAWGLWTGSVWSEDAEGTNGIGTCLVERRPLTIHCDQHFFSRNTALSCTTAPVYDHEGNLAAALDVSSCRADLTESFVNLISVAVGDAARAIEAVAFRQAFPDRRIVLTPDAKSGSASLLALDKDDLVVGATRAARRVLGPTSEWLGKPVPAGDDAGGRTCPSEDLARAERAAMKRTLARVDGNVSAAAKALGISRATFYRKLGRVRRDPH
ncbi:GAF domain-containing protein [Breoghania sp. L-A4]|uniref:GAF domain-containing protein n=1 Tax=Breoghania sp. L-A4 TaxID=2304600 RepID=UPI000E3607C4|nr:GAF domain-containing protein [Breoghania sp. L-A4]AXS41372.1 sigma-54-dependent Fis family transcriptional regulator [Breoghania sp. L-A4]